MRLPLLHRLLAALLLSGGLMAPDLADAADPQAPTVQVSASRPNRTHFTDRGVTIPLWVEHTALDLVRLTDRSRIDLFTDDTGRDLRETAERRRGPITGRRWLDDARRFRIDLSGKAAGAEATSVRVKGTLVFDAASKRKRERSEPGDLAAGTTFEIAGRTFRIMTLMVQPDTPADSKARTLVLTTTDDTADVAEVRFLGAEGEVLPGRDYGRSTGRFGAVRSTTWNYHMAEPPARIRIELALYDGIRTIEVPFDVTQPIVR